MFLETMLLVDFYEQGGCIDRVPDESESLV